VRLLRPLRSTGSATTLTSSGSNAAGGPGSVGPADNPVQGLFQRLPLPEVSSARRPSPSFRARGSDLPSPSLAHARSRPGRVEHDRGLYYWIDVYEEGHWQRDLTTAAPRLPTMDGGLGSREPARASWVCLPARPGSRRQPSEANTTKVSLQSIPSPRRTYLQSIYRATTLTPRSERVFPFRSIQAARRARPAQRSSLPPPPPPSVMESGRILPIQEEQDPASGPLPCATPPMQFPMPSTATMLQPRPLSPPFRQ